MHSVNIDCWLNRGEIVSFYSSTLSLYLFVYSSNNFTFSTISQSTDSGDIVKKELTQTYFAFAEGANNQITISSETDINLAGALYSISTQCKGIISYTNNQSLSRRYYRDSKENTLFPNETRCIFIAPSIPYNMTIESMLYNDRLYALYEDQLYGIFSYYHYINCTSPTAIVFISVDYCVYSGSFSILSESDSKPRFDIIDEVTNALTNNSYHDCFKEDYHDTSMLDAYTVTLFIASFIIIFSLVYTCIRNCKARHHHRSDNSMSSEGGAPNMRLCPEIPADVNIGESSSQSDSEQIEPPQIIDAYGIFTDQQVESRSLYSPFSSSQDLPNPYQGMLK